MKNFESIVGHEQIIRHMKNSILQGKASHAYILAGEPGAGKKTLANIYVKVKARIRARNVIPAGRQTVRIIRILYMWNMRKAILSVWRRSAPRLWMTYPYGHTADGIKYILSMMRIR